MASNEDPSKKPSSRLSRLHRKLSRQGSRQNSTFSPSDILPRDGHNPYPNRPQSDNAPLRRESTQPIFGAPKSHNGSASPPNVFDDESAQQEHDTEPTELEEDGQGSYDLNPPPPRTSPSNVEYLASRFFSADHLDLILRDPHHGTRFTRFLETCKPQYSSTLSQYVESRKAIAAVDYANAIAARIPVKAGEAPFLAAIIDDEFETAARQTAEALVEEALPLYLTTRLVSLVTESLVKNIIGTNTPAMQELVPNLAEVYTISDPAIEDNPIVYASEEFFNMTAYGRDYAIGRNCRFLQGPKTPTLVTKRLAEASAAGEAICETILNYRRDGSPFLNLLMIAPLYDNKGSVRYFLGCQIDITPLIDGGKGVDSFAQLLAQDHSDSQMDDSTRRQDPLDFLGELGQMLNEPEANFVRNRLRSNSFESGRATPQQPKRRPTARRFLSMDDNTYGPSTASMGSLWPDASYGHSGRLPGVYRNYLLVRPYPSLRVTFTSPALRIPGLLQSKLTSRIGGPEAVRTGLLDSLSSGTSVTAKVSWLTNPQDSEDEGKLRWIHCTPLIGSDGKVGVWMVVLVEEEGVTGMLNRQDSRRSARSGGQWTGKGRPGPDRRTTGNVLYAEYLKGGESEGEDGQEYGGRETASAKEKREVDDQFRDFDG